MNRLIGIFLIFVLLQTVSRTQEITLGAEKPFFSDNAHYLLGKLDKNIVLFSQVSNKYNLDIYNLQLQYLRTKEIFFERSKVDINSIIPGEGHFSIVYTYFQKMEVVTQIRKFDSGGELMDSIKLIEGKSFTDNGGFSHIVSKNKQKLLLIRPDGYNSMEIMLVDIAGFKKLWQKSIVFEDYNLDIDLTDIAVADDGFVYLAFEKFNFSWQKNKHFQHVFMISPENAALSSVKIDFQGKIMSDFAFTFDQKEGFVIGAGLFSQKSTENAAGYFMYKLKNGAIDQEIVFTPFSLRTLHNNQLNRRRVAKELSDLHVSDVLVKNDGGVLIIAETRKVLRRESARNRFTDYHYEDIFIFCTRPDGSLFWDDQIRKYQLSYDDKAMYSSYFLMSTPSQVRLIFNDEIKNENTISEYVFNPLGQGRRKSLFSTELHRLKLLFSSGIQIGSDSFVVPSMAEGKYRIVLVQY